MTRRAERGLSLLEALVAIAILGLALGSLMEWRAALVRQHARANAAAAELTAKRNALALLLDMNPMATPEGALEIGPGERVTWRAAAVTPTRRNRAYPFGDGDFNVALYRVDATVERAGHPPVSFSLERMGWSPMDGVTDAR